MSAILVSILLKKFYMGILQFALAQHEEDFPALLWSDGEQLS